MSYSANVIAYAFVRKGIDDGNPVTQMKLQKLVYFAHGVHLALYKEPLISEKFQAWDYGPVVPMIYNTYKLYGSSPITEDTWTLYDYEVNESGYGLKKIDLGQLDSRAKKSIDTTWNLLKDFSALQLSNWSHSLGSPWRKRYTKGVSDSVIPNEDIEEYFEKNFIEKA